MKLERLIERSHFHKGHVREEAVRQLARCHTGEELEALLLRLNDWVEPFRLFVRAALEARLTQEYASYWLALARTIHRISQGRRADHSWLKAGLYELFQKPECRSVIEQARLHSDPYVRRLAWEPLLATYPREHPIWEQALDSTVVSQYAAQILGKELPVEELAALTLRRLRKKPAFIGSLLLARLAERSSTQAEPVLKAALLAPGRTLRQYARFYLQASAPEFDAAQYYRDALANTPTAMALSGLAETGNSADAALVLPFLERWPAEALAALARLSFPEALPHLMDALESTSIQLRHIALGSLLGHAQDAEERAARLAFDNTLPDGIRDNAYRVLLGLTHYRQIAYLLRGLDIPCLNRSAENGLRQWLNRSHTVFLRPTPAERVAFQETLTACKSLPLDTRRTLEHILSGLVS